MATSTTRPVTRSCSHDALVAARREPRGLAGHRALDGVRLVAGGEQHHIHAPGPLEGDAEHRPHLLPDDVVGGVARHVAEGEQGHHRPGSARRGRGVGAGQPRGGRRRGVGAGRPRGGGHGCTAGGAASSGSAGTPRRRGAACGRCVRRRHAGIPPAGSRRAGRGGRGGGRGRAARGGVPGCASHCRSAVVPARRRPSVPRRRPAVTPVGRPRGGPASASALRRCATRRCARGWRQSALRASGSDLARSRRGGAPGRARRRPPADRRGPSRASLP